MSTLGSVRRYYLAKRHAAADVHDHALELVWWAKQEEEPGTSLADTFPYRTRLSERGYTTYEDLHGADVRELEQQGFTSYEAAAIIAAVEEELT